VRPLGFRLDDRSLKRAGLDYWDKLDLVVWDDLEGYLESLDADRMVLTSSKTGQSYHRITYKPDDHLVFGAETSGLPKELFRRFPARIGRIPVHLDKVRSLNLSTAVGVVVYEALRQTGTLPGDQIQYANR
jgi:tRNA (cytidine/uridine-2'-O-)-methyltransferase